MNYWRMDGWESAGSKNKTSGSGRNFFQFRFRPELLDLVSVHPLGGERFILYKYIYIYLIVPARSGSNA